MTDRAINAVLRYPTGLASRVRIVWLRALGARIGPSCRVVAPDIPRNPWDIVLERGVALDRNVTLLATGPRQATPRLRIGARTYVNRNTMFDASHHITVGTDVMIGPNCYITDHDHGTDPGRPVAAQQLVEAAVRIGDNVWLGAGVIVLKGVSIGDNAVVGAGAVVTRDVAPGARVAGNPARPIAQRA